MKVSGPFSSLQKGLVITLRINIDNRLLVEVEGRPSEQTKFAIQEPVYQEKTATGRLFNSEFPTADNRTNT